MEKKLIARALEALARELDFQAAARSLPELDREDWRRLLNEAAAVFTAGTRRAKASPAGPGKDKAAAKAAPKAAPSPEKALLYTDGACRGNPGPSAAGAVLIDREVEMGYISRYLGRMTNNQAEYHALILGLEMAMEQGYNKLSLRLDSQLIVRQVQGRYKVKNAAIKPLFAQVQALLNRLESYDILHVERALNQRADALANLALDNR